MQQKVSHKLLAVLFTGCSGRSRDTGLLIFSPKYSGDLVPAKA